MRQRVMVASVAVLTSALLLGQMGGCPGGDAGTGASFNLPPVVVLNADVTVGIVPLTVRFSSSDSSDDGLIVSRVWNFGDGATSQEISPTHTFRQTGDFTVRLTLTDDGSPPLSSSRTVIVRVTQAPVARITVDRTTAESAPAVFAFDGTESFDPDGTITAYAWDFGDGTTDNKVAVAHTYSRPGVYRAQLTVTDNTGVRGTAVVVIDVGIPQPDIAFRVPPSNLRNLVVAQDAPLWAAVNYDVEPDVPYFLQAGLDSDVDPCEAQTIIYDVATGGTLTTILGHRGPVRAARFSPDGTSVLTGSDDGTVRQNDAVSGDLIFNYLGNDDANPDAGVTSVAWAPDGSAFAFGMTSGRTVLRSALTGAVLLTLGQHAGPVNSVAFAPGGLQLVTGGVDRRVLLWDLRTGQVVREFVGHELAVTAVAYQGQRVFTASHDGTARVWNPATGAETLRFSAHGASVLALTASIDGAVVVTGGGDNRALQWDAVTGVISRTYADHASPVVSVAMSPDSTRVATGSRDASLRLWSTTTGELLRKETPCDSAIASLHFSPDGQHLVAAVAAANDIPLDTAEGQGNDLTLTTPLPLNLNTPEIEPGTYFLWVEVRTDRTAPVRRYAPTVVQVIPALPSEIGPDVPTFPLYANEANVVVAPAPRRQIFDLGPLNRGDRIIMSYLTVPGFGEYYQEIPSLPGGRADNRGLENDGFSSVMILDRDERVVAWYQDTGVLFTPDAKIIVGANSASHYVITDTGTSVRFRIERNVGLTPRGQKLFLDFRGAQDVYVGGAGPISIPSLTALLQATTPYTITQIETELKPSLVQRLRALLLDYDITITTSDEGPPPSPPYQTLYFGGQFAAPAGSGLPVDLGRADYVDPRNETLTGTGVVGVTGLINAMTPPAQASVMGLRIGNAAGHTTGFLLGLRRTANTGNDIMDPVRTWELLDTWTPAFGSGLLRGAEQYSGPPIGIQDAPLLLDQTVGPS
jgi:WD40 repeat protein